MADLQVLQNKAARITMDLPAYYFGTDTKSEDHNIVFFFMYKCVNNMFLHNFNYGENRDIHGYNTRHNKDVCKSKFKTNWGQSTIINESVDHWNTLDVTIREAPNLASFKRRL